MEESIKEGMVDRFLAGQPDGLDMVIAVFLLAMVGALAYIIWSYARGLKESPRELYLLFFTKVTEYSAYGGAQMAFVLYLHNDVGLSDMAAGSYIGIWSVALSGITMVVGAVCDAIGVKRTLLIGCFALLFARATMPFMDSIVLVSIFGFLPLAFGIAITGPVLSVGIKKFTTPEGATLGFGLFYTMMNVGWAIGGWIFDAIRGIFGDKQTHVLPLADIEISTYQIIFAVGFFLTIPDLIAIMLMRNNVLVTEDGVKILPTEPSTASKKSPWATILGLMREALAETGRILSRVVREKAFWLFIFMLSILVFVRLTFYHFHYTFPTYGIRVFGEGVKVGNIFGVLNPVMIVFLVPLVAALTKKIKSYQMLLVGSAISAGSVFIATLPADIFSPLMNTMFGELVFDRWLEVPVAERTPFYLSLVVFISIFTIGEAIWSPRLMQFTAEIAPKGKEGSYIALSYLPYFGAKFLVGPMSGWLITTYVPEGQESYPEHYMVWMWIGIMASLSPFGLVAFRRLFKRAERHELDEADEATPPPKPDAAAA